MTMRLGLLWPMVVSGLIALPLAAYGEQSPRPAVAIADSELRTAIAAFEGYNQALVERNYAKVRNEFLHAPFVIVDNAPRVIADINAVVEGLRKTRDSFEADGYSTTTIGSPQVSRLDNDRLLLNCRLRHLRKDGSLLVERANFYLLVKVGGAWKIAGIIPQDPALIAR